MSLDSFLDRAVRTNVKEPYHRIRGAVSQSPALSKGPKLIGELAKEATLLPVRNIAHISSWTVGAMYTLFTGTLKLGLKSAMLLPLPIPGGFENLAQVRASTRARLQALDHAVHTGDPRTLATIAEEIKNGMRGQSPSLSTAA